MARPRSFDLDRTLDRAVELFRARGWRRTSLDDLVGELGVPRQSLYNTFGDKEELYRSALRRYRGCQSEAFAERMRDPRPTRELLAELFAAKIDEVLAAPGEWGCLVLNATFERPEDERAGREVERHHEAMERVLAARLERARDAGEIGARHPPRALARYLLGALTGLAVVGHGRPERKPLEDVARVTLAALD